MQYGRGFLLHRYESVYPYGNRPKKEVSMKRGGVLFEAVQRGPFPMHRLRRITKPTTLITSDVQRIDVRENAFNKAGSRTGLRKNP
jgi:hypothetical protein